MSLGEAAKEAMKAALNAYNAVVRLEAVVELFRKAYEAHEKRTHDRMAELEQRLREVESKLASLGGRVDGGLADALKIVLLQPEIRRRAAALLAGDAEEKPLPAPTGE